MSNTDTPIHQVLIVGAGFSGLGTALRLQQNGVDDVVILERAADIGGTWRDNTYPGAACDIPSNLYSFSFAQNPRWTRSYAGSDEIRDYIHWLAEEYDLRRLVRFNRSVTGLSYDDASGVWTATTEEGDTVRARSAVMAQGPLSNPSFPNIPGLERFQGKTIHSADWDHDYDFEGKAVGVIGTGASGVQIVPELAKQAKKLRVFQRTPCWILPRLDFRKPDWQKAVFRKLPAAQSAVRNGLFLAHESIATGIIWDTPVNGALETLAKAHLRHQVKDKWLRRQLTPDFKLGCKRVLMSSDFYPALQKDNTELITWPIASISENGVRTGEGIEHQFDCLVFATGFSVPNSGTPFPVYGLNGRELGQEWRRGAQAYKSINVSGYPNLFMIFGPNSGPGHNSALVYIESQIEYIVKGVTTLRSLGIKALDVKDDVQATHNRRLQKRLAKTNWNSGCKSWYLTEDGYNATMYPGFASQYARQMKHLELRDYRLLSGSGAPQ
ncbi:4-hydroxyacetophenone monooxygenase [Tamilnaduibacter salinus]|uniref:4-hydroxyacetophenone monooxygenase n=1 Tax=Tamilnaduibacter salinus TaxID=1484056 RepID=A0A2A2I1C8_9GAMM|nr:NAD(P)/FAD-dependent oxidoreductase [Tamilnaduibacter salinus]PAV25539.1 4-hydroxyacetophenone monooxygenase [Tamilnaduibacter salinus]